MAGCNGAGCASIMGRSKTIFVDFATFSIPPYRPEKCTREPTEDRDCIFPVTLVELDAIDAACTSLARSIARRCRSVIFDDRIEPLREAGPHARRPQLDVAADMRPTGMIHEALLAC